MNKIISTLTLVAALSTAHAQHTPVADLAYSVDNGEVTITGLNNYNITDINIPPTIEGFPVTRIGSYAFNYNYGINSVVLPASVTHIEEAAFSSSQNLQSIEMPGVTYIDDFAFNGSVSLTTITLPASIESIGDYAFEDSDSLTTITLPASLESIGEGAFGDCDSLTSFSVASGNPNFTSLGGVLFNKAITELLQYPKGNPATTYSIPQSVEIISTRAFESTSLTSITLPNSLASIGFSAFSHCDSLTSITLPDMLTTISDYAFFSCNSLTSVTLPASLTSISEYAFSYCTSLTSVTSLGNAPTLGIDVFLSTPATIYVYEGATGFGSTFGGRPVVVLAISPLPIDSITVENGNLIIKPTNGTDGITIEQTDDLVDGTWTTITPTIVDGCIQLPVSGTADYYRLSN